MITLNKNGTVMTTVTGQIICWRRQDVPINVYLDVSMLRAEAMEPARTIALNVVRQVNVQLGVKAFLLPVEPDRMTLVNFHDTRQTVFQSVLIRAQDWSQGLGVGGWTCTADLELDTRNGQLRNAIVDWFVLGNEADQQQTLTHELGHCLGLGHYNGTVMQAVRGPGQVLPWVNAQLSAIGGLYKIGNCN